MERNESWNVLVGKQKDRITEEVAQYLSQNFAEYFGRNSKALVGDRYNLAYDIARQHVLSRDDLAPDEIIPVVEKIMGQASQYGPLQKFFVDRGAEEITEIMVNPSPDDKPKIFVGRHGQHYYMGNDYFNSNNEVKEYSQKICQDCSREFTLTTPTVDAWLKDGSRVSVYGYNASPFGTGLTIRKSPLRRPPMPLEKLLENNMFPHLLYTMTTNLLIKGHANFGCMGRTDSGKTSFVRAAGEHIEPENRVMIGEVSFELSFPNLPNCVNLVEVEHDGKKLFNLANICELFLRNNPDIAVVGEIRGGEAVAAAEMAEAISCGFVTTGHAGGVNEVRSRLLKMFQRGGMDIKADQIDSQIGTMFNFLLFFDKAWDGRRVLMSFVEVTTNGEYRTIIRLDEEEFARTNGKTVRWKYENAITSERISRLAFRGANILPEYEKTNGNQHLYARSDL